MSAYSELVQQMLEVRRRECDIRDAHADELAHMAGLFQDDPDCGFASVLRNMARHNRIKALELKGDMAAFKYEHGQVPYIED